MDDGDRTSAQKTDTANVQSTTSTTSVTDTTNVNNNIPSTSYSRCKLIPHDDPDDELTRRQKLPRSNNIDSNNIHHDHADNKNNWTQIQPNNLTTMPSDPSQILDYLDLEDEGEGEFKSTNRTGEKKTIKSTKSSSTKEQDETTARLTFRARRKLRTDKSSSLSSDSTIDSSLFPGAVAMGHNGARVPGGISNQSVQQQDEEPTNTAERETSEPYHQNNSAYVASAQLVDDSSLNQEMEELRQTVNILQQQQNAQPIVPADAIIAIPVDASPEAGGSGLNSGVQGQAAGQGLLGWFHSKDPKLVLLSAVVLIVFVVTATVITTIIVINNNSSDDEPLTNRLSNNSSSTSTPTLLRATPNPTPAPFEEEEEENSSSLAPTTQFSRPTGCENVTGPLPMGSYRGELVSGSYISGDTSEAPIIALPEDCVWPRAQATQGLWYTIVGTGTPMMVTSCGDFYRQLTLLNVTSCTFFECLNSAAFGDWKCFDGDGIRWNSTEGRQYYIVAHGRDDEEFGTFDLRVGEVAENDCCEGAIPITLDSEYHGDTSFSSSLAEESYDEDVAVETCVDISQQESSDDYSIQDAGGLWYTLVGQNQALSARTYCLGIFDDGFIETQISVFSGSCETLMCIVGIGSSGQCCAGDEVCLPNQVDWFAQSGQTYYIHVFGTASGVSGSGKFSLMVQETNSPIPTLPPVVDQTNDFCADAIGPLILDEKISGTTDGAQNSQAPRCGSATEQQNSGVWYSFVGTGEEIFLTTCDDDGSYYATDNDFHRQVSVFKGPCESLECVDGSSTDFSHSCYGKAGASWESTLGQMYYILIHGEYLGSSGSFVLRLGTRPLNNRCEDAIALEMNAVTPGITSFASSSDMGPCGGATRQRSSGVWYTFTNDDPAAKSVVITTCTPEFLGIESSTPVQLAVFRGSCDRLLCVDGSTVDPEAICDSTKEAGVVWQAEPGTKYSILVYHEGYELSGSFGIVVRETALEVSPIVPAPANDLCSGAIALPAEGLFLEGSTAGADYDIDMFPNAAAPGVFYFFYGTGEGMFPFAEELSDDGFEVELLVSRTPCNASETFSYSSYNGFLSEQGTKYLMYVHSWYRGSAGNFFVGLSKSSLSCSSALPMNFDEIIEGDTTYGSDTWWTSENNLCGVGAETNSIWYSFQAGNNDEEVVVTTCTGNTQEGIDADTRVSVLTFEEGETCFGTYNCETWNEDDASDSCMNGEASVSWTALTGKKYFIAVSSLTTDVGKFRVVLLRQ